MNKKKKKQKKRKGEKRKERKRKEREKNRINNLISYSLHRNRYKS